MKVNLTKVKITTTDKFDRSSASRPNCNGPDNGAEGGHVIGIDIGGSNLRVALADSNGHLLGKWSASTKATSSPEMVVQQIREGVDSLLECHSVSQHSLVAAAAGAPGITRVDAGIVVATSYLKGWKNVAFRDLLESALQVPATVENDAKLAAVGENWKGVARGLGSFAFLAIGTGVGAGIFANGKLIHGKHWAAGEIGYMYVPGASSEAVAPGTPGSLESTIGGEGVRQQWLRCCAKAGVNGSGDLTATEIFDRAVSGDQFAQAVLNRTAQALAYAVYNICLVLDCECVVLGGGVGMSLPLRDATQRLLDQYKEPALPKLATSALGEDAQLTGAFRLALDIAESRKRS
jgi:glucokinase